LAQQVAEGVQSGHSLWAPPENAGVLESVGDAKQQIGEGHLAASRLREQGYGEREGATGSDQKILDDGLVGRDFADGLDISPGLAHGAIGDPLSTRLARR